MIQYSEFIQVNETTLINLSSVKRLELQGDVLLIALKEGGSHQIEKNGKKVFDQLSIRAIHPFD